MTMTDPIADMLTRIRNACRNGVPSVVMPSSRLKVNIAKVLKEEGYITDYEVHEDGPRAHLTVGLKYGGDGERVIQTIERVSKPGCRRFRGVEDLPRVLNGLGIAILSTNKGVMSDRRARELNVGGEVICTVY